MDNILRAKCTIIFLLTSLATLAHSTEVNTLTGQVIKNQLGGEPIARVQVFSPDASAPKVTDNFGGFTLTFPQLSPGDQTQILAKKTGWVVVNDLQINRFILPKHSQSPNVTILLAKSEERDKWAMLYYRVKGESVVEALYQAKLLALEKQHKNSAEAIRLLQRERDQAKKQVDQLAKELAQIKPQEADNDYQHAMQLFLDNQLEAALLVLDEKKL
ncbi:hypothetical protein, partial [Teredinibacter turnerae]|uniref:hypothetical protein n=1 Tax=Teredinibacter turnerae TaxID=2426 RepID=UPI0005644062